MSVKTAPLYYTVMTYLIDRIEKEFNPGDLIPTQTEIAEVTKTSLITVKRAVNELVNEGILETIAGKGTFAKHKPLIDTHVGISSWTDSIAGIGALPETLSIEIKKYIPNKVVAHILKLKARNKTVLIKRIRSINNKPICIMYNELNAELVPDLEKGKFDSESLYAFLKEQYNLIADFATEEVYARDATNEELLQLKMEDNIVIVIERLSFLTDQKPFEISRIIAPASQYRYKSLQINSTLRNINHK